MFKFDTDKIVTIDKESYEEYLYNWEEHELDDIELDSWEDFLKKFPGGIIRADQVKCPVIAQAGKFTVMVYIGSAWSDYEMDTVENAYEIFKDGERFMTYDDSYGLYFGWFDSEVPEMSIKVSSPTKVEEVINRFYDLVEFARSK